MIGDRQRVVDIGDAEPAGGDDAVLDDAERDAGHLVFAHLRLGQRDDGVELRIRGRLRGRRRRNQSKGSEGNEDAFHDAGL